MAAEVEWLEPSDHVWDGSTPFAQSFRHLALEGGLANRDDDSVNR